LSSSIETGVPIQPVAIQYLRDGKPDQIAPFIGDDDLLSHLRRLFANEVSEVRIQLLAPIESAGKERAALAFEAQQAVQVALFGKADQPADVRPAARAA
jgi:1-acyl-sn-glycerol-3-phosphate acyltransferase